MRILSVIYLVFMLCSANLAAKTMLVLGDSLSAAYGLPVTQGWVHLLDEKLPNWTLVNGAISGDTSQGALNRLPALLQKQPDYLLIEIGANDGLRGYPVQRIRTNIQQIIDMAKKAGIKVVLMQIRIPPNYGPKYTQQFENLYPDIAKAQDVTLWPFFMEKVAVDASLMQADGLHPNAKGQLVIVHQLERLLATLE